MKSVFTVVLLAGLSFGPTALAKGFYCIATPHHNNPRVPKLPGYGHGATRAQSSAAAVRSCKSRNALAKHTCAVRGNYCFPE